MELSKSSPYLFVLLLLYSCVHTTRNVRQLSGGFYIENQGHSYYGNVTLKGSILKMQLEYPNHIKNLKQIKFINVESGIPLSIHKICSLNKEYGIRYCNANQEEVYKRDSLFIDDTLFTALFTINDSIYRKYDKIKLQIVFVLEKDSIGTTTLLDAETLTEKRPIRFH